MILKMYVVRLVKWNQTFSFENGFRFFSVVGQSCLLPCKRPLNSASISGAQVCASTPNQQLIGLANQRLILLIGTNLQAVLVFVCTLSYTIYKPPF